MSRPSGWDVVGFGSDPVPGDVWEIKALARTYSRIGEAAEDARVRLQSVKGSGWLTEWEADSGDVFIAKIESLPSDLESCADSYLAVGGVLTAWADDVDDAQYTADRALAAAKDAQADAASAQASLGGAQSTYNSYNSQVVAAEKLRKEYPEGEGAPEGTRVPTDYQFKALKNNRAVAQNRVNELGADIADANSRVEAARRLVVEAHGDWSDRESATVTAIGTSADAGLGEQSSWDKVFGSEVWETIITVCKVVVAIGGIIVLIIGGPLAWLVLAAALLVLADTLYKMSKGQADGWDLAFALLDCIPGGKGLTTAAGLIGGVAALAKGGPGALKAMKLALMNGDGIIKNADLLAHNPTGLHNTATTNALKGEFGESQTLAMFDNAGFTNLGVKNSVSTNGIDHVFQNPKTGEMFVVESKFSSNASASGESLLKNTKDSGVQMGDTWLSSGPGASTTSRLDSSVGTLQGKVDLATAFSDGSLVRVVVKIDPSGVCTPQLLDNLAKAIDGSIATVGGGGVSFAAAANVGAGILTAPWDFDQASSSLNSQFSGR